MRRFPPSQSNQFIDEVLDLFSNPLLASPLGEEVKKKEVQSSYSELDLFAPPPVAPLPLKKVKGEKALSSVPSVAPLASKRRTRSTIPRETDPLGVGDWSEDKDILCRTKCSVAWKSMHHVRGLLRLLMSRECPGGCKLLNLGHTRQHGLGAVATLLWSIAAAKRGNIGLCVPSIVVSGCRVSLFGFGDP